MITQNIPTNLHPVGSAHRNCAYEAMKKKGTTLSDCSCLFPPSPWRGLFTIPYRLLSSSYGLSWSPLKEGHLLSGSDDCKVCLWDVTAATSSPGVLQATNIFSGHSSVVEDVAWHLHHPTSFGSVGDDKALIMCVIHVPLSVILSFFFFLSFED